MKQLKTESDRTAKETEKNFFDLDRLELLLSLLLDDQNDMRSSIAYFNRFLQFCDVQYFTIRVLHKSVRQMNQQKPQGNISSFYSINAASLISAVRIPNLNDSKGIEQLNKLKYLCKASGFRFKYDLVAKMYTTTCTTFLSFSVSIFVRKLLCLQTLTFVYFCFAMIRIRTILKRSKRCWL